MVDKKEEYSFSLNPGEDSNPSIFLFGQPPESEASQEPAKKPSFIREKPKIIESPEEKVEIVLERPKKTETEVKEKQETLSEISESNHIEEPKKFKREMDGSRKTRVLFTASFLTVMLLFLFFMASPSITMNYKEGEMQPMATYAAKIDYALMNDESFSFDLDSSDYNLEDASAMSLGLSGAVIGDGVVKVYLVDEQGKEYSLYDNEVEKSDNFFRLSGITGMEINTEIAGAVEDAQAAADLARSAANNAQTYANNAQTAANNAQTAANSASSIASQATIKSNEIGTSAAKSLASSANAAASSAQTKAKDASSAAANSQKLANDAASKADEAQSYVSQASENPSIVSKIQNVAGDAQTKASQAHDYEITAESKEEETEGDKNQTQNYLNQILAMLPPTPPSNQTQPPSNQTQPPSNQTTTPPENQTSPEEQKETQNQIEQNQQTKPGTTSQTPSQVAKAKEEQKKAEEIAKKEAAKAKNIECKNCKSLNDIIKKNKKNATVTINETKEKIQEELKEMDYSEIVTKVKETEIEKLEVAAPPIASETTAEKTISGAASQEQEATVEQIGTVSEMIKAIPPKIKKFEYSCVDTCYAKIKSGKYALKVKIEGKAAVWLNRLIIEA